MYFIDILIYKHFEIEYIAYKNKKIWHYIYLLSDSVSDSDSETGKG